MKCSCFAADRLFYNEHHLKVLLKRRSITEYGISLCHYWMALNIVQHKKSAFKKETKLITVEIKKGTVVRLY